MNKALLFSAISFFMWSCTKPDINYESDWVIPIIKTKIKAEQISQLENLSLKAEAKVNNVPGLTINAPIPASVVGVNIGPIFVEDVDDYFIRAKADTVQFKIYITNNFPVNIKAGTKVQYRNTTSNNDIVCEYEIPRDIAPNAMDSIIPSQITTTTGWIDNDLNMFLINYKTDGSGGTVAGFTNESAIKVQIRLIVLRINEVELSPDKFYDLKDTSDFSLGDESLVGIKKATITTYWKNHLPVYYNTQVYFLNSNKTVIDSLFVSTEEVPGATVQPDGYVPVDPSVGEKVWTADWSEAKALKLKEQAKYTYMRAYFRTQQAPPSKIKLRHDNQLGFQMVGDFSINVKISE